MKPRKITKKQIKEVRRKKLILLLLILVFFLASFFLLRQILFTKKTLFISPISSLGFYQNTDFEGKLRKTEIEYENLTFKNNSYQFQVKGEGMVIISTEKNLDSQLSSLQLTLRQLKIEGRRFKSLDFRFDKPVIVLL
jgi:hypothetical protein